MKLIERIAKLDRLYLLREQLFTVYARTPIDSDAERRAWAAVQKTTRDYQSFAMSSPSTCDDWHLVGRP